MALQRISFLIAAVLVSTGLAAGAVHAQQQNTTGQPPDTMRKQQAAPAAPQMQPAQVVLSKMHLVNKLEMKAGQLACQRGHTELLRHYGERLFRDHRLADRKVTGLASDLGIELVKLPQLPGSQQKMKMMMQKMQQLKQTRGRAFDRMFLQMMVKAHKFAIQWLRQAVPKLQDAERGRNLVKTVLPILGQHLTLAQHLQT